MRRAPYRELVESRHPLYRSRSPFWRLAWMSYRGGPEYLAAPNLFSHRLEHADDHRRRMARSYYLNYCRPVVDTYASYLFKTNPTVLPDEPIRNLVENADGRGHHLFAVMKQAFTLSAVYGQVIVGADRPRSVVKPATRAEELALGLSDYFYLVIPQDFLNWSMSEGGDLSWCLVRQRIRRATPEDPGGEEGGAETYRLWTADFWRDLDGQGEVVTEGENPYGRVPFVSCRFRESDDAIVGESLLGSIVHINREIFNLSSMLSEILYRQTFSQLVAEGSAHEYGEGGDIGRLGTSSIFLYPEGRKPPQFISPDAAQARMLMEQIDNLIDEIYRMACLTRGRAREGTLVSGISKAFDFLDTNQALSDAAHGVERTFVKAIRIAAPEWGGSIQFPGDFGVTDSGELLNQVERASRLPIGPAFKRRLLEKLARSVLSELPPTQRDEVVREIGEARLKAEG